MNFLLRLHQFIDLHDVEIRLIDSFEMMLHLNSLVCPRRANRFRAQEKDRPVSEESQFESNQGNNKESDRDRPDPTWLARHKGVSAECDSRRDTG